MLSRFSCVPLFVTPWIVACQAALSMGFSRQEDWRGLMCSSLGTTQGPNPRLLRPPPALAGSSPLVPLGSPTGSAARSHSLKEESESCPAVSNSLQPHGLHSPGNSPGHNTGMGSLFLLQGIFPTQGLNPGLPHYRQILYQLSHQGSPRILEWVAYPFSRGSSRPRNQSRVSCIAGGFFTN